MGLIVFVLVIGAIWLVVMSGGVLGLLAHAARLFVEALDWLFDKRDGRSSGVPTTAETVKVDADVTSRPLIKKHKVRCPCGETHLIAAHEQIRCSGCQRLIALPARDRRRPPTSS